ncbi:hypothetical protein [Pseudomonas sp. F1002]|uniref:hypothetical protein n=1 Tax=Pseudomonas sp. F1002 TaxID=2738821 RepID=UPI0015A1A99D|nr:hypothetical protein [Pseudomonas sp. F1002]NWB63548.1 hypothetical protein [Pseudomonas sp. F1002]
MAKRQLKSYGVMAVGQRVEYARLDNPSKEEPETICSEHTITAIRECDTGVLVTLKGAAATIVKAFDSSGRTWGGFGSLRVLQDESVQLVIRGLNNISKDEMKHE